MLKVCKFYFESVTKRCMFILANLTAELCTRKTDAEGVNKTA